MKRAPISERLLNVAVNLAVTGTSLHRLAKQLELSVAQTQQLIGTLLSQGRIYEVHTKKKTTYHTVRAYTNRVAALRPSALYARLIAHMKKYAHRKWPLKEMAQQLKASAEQVQAEFNRGVGAGDIQRSQVGALPLYGLC